MLPRFTLPQRWPLLLIGALILSLSLVTIVGERGALHLWRLRGEKSRLDEQNYRLQKENVTRCRSGWRACGTKTKRSAGALPAFAMTTIIWRK